MKQVEIQAQARAAMAAEARAGYPYEICGALVGRFEGDRASILRTVPFPNDADDAVKRRRFTIDPGAVLKLERTLRGGPDRLLGFYHSHPDAEAVPSATDMEYFRLWPETVWIIVKVNGGEPKDPRAWWLADPEGTVEELLVGETGKEKRET